MKRQLTCNKVLITIPSHLDHESIYITIIMKMMINYYSIYYYGIMVYYYVLAHSVGDLYE